MRAFAIRDA